MTDVRASAQHPRVGARLVLAFMAALLSVMVGFVASSAGPTGAVVYAQETESPSPEPTGPAIQLLNPNETYDPVIVSPSEPAERPKISDRYDGTDTAYHVVAVTRQAPVGAVVEAYWQEDGENELTVGQLSRVAGSDDTWELFWDVPSDWDEGNGDFKVRLYRPSGASFEQVAEDIVAAELRHEGTYGEGDDEPSEQTVEMLWPSDAGELGFYKPKGGSWRTFINGTSSGEYVTSPSGQRQVIDSVVRVRLFYTVDPPGVEPVYKQCGEADPGDRKDDGTETWGATCTLTGKDTPSQVVGVAAVATGFDRPFPSGLIAETTMESADAHRIDPYIQDPAQMDVAIEGVGGGTSASYPTSRRRLADSGCLRFRVTVTDQNERPVQGANVDVHMQGPSDQAAFGDDESSGSSSTDSNGKAPDGDKDDHREEGRRYCSDRVTSTMTQSEHNLPGEDDRKHLESVAGTGLDGGGAGAGQWLFLIVSPDAGLADVTAWVDAEPVTDEAAGADADDDIARSGESAVTTLAQWLPAAMRATISPRADSATVGECNRFVLSVRAGNAEVPDVNVDVHATGPTNDLDFCDPGDGTPRRAPDRPEGDGAHVPEDEGESHHESDSPDRPETQHTEGETDETGNFIFGLTSPAIGSTEIQAWVDGEEGQDNDVRASSEVTATAGKSWVGSAQDAEVRFVNPSGYGGSGDTLSMKRDANEQFHLVARVDLPEVVEGVEFFYSSNGTTFTALGAGTRVGTSDAWELFVTIPDGDYTLRAQIINTDKREDREVEVDSSLEAAEITGPADGESAPFDDGETTVRGVASADAEGVEFYYTKTDARETRNAGQWISCGETELPTGDAPQNFEGQCALQGTDAPLDVTGIAALTFVCDPITGCQTIEGETIGREHQTGDAHRVFGFESNPSVTLEPTETSARTGRCRRFEVEVTDSDGRAIPNANVDVHLTGPGDAAGFCDLDSSSPRRAPESGNHSASSDGEAGQHQNDGPDTHHTEGEADEGGKFVFGVGSSKAGDSDVTVWIDENDDDLLDTGETSDRSALHWTPGGGGGRGCTINGDSDNNVIRGTSGNDVICARGGNDSIRGRGGNDIIFGGGGNDDVRGNRGNDKMVGGAGGDTLRGGRGHDIAKGGKDNDTIRTYAGRDRVAGGRGDDVISAGPGNDVLRGNGGRDTLNGGRGRDKCDGGGGRNSVSKCEP